MLRLDRVIKPWTESGALNSQINLYGFWNTHTFQMHLSDSERYRFGWTGYKEAQNSTIVAGQLLVALNVLCQYPWANVQQYGINS